MELSLSSKVERLIEDQVKAENFPSAEAVVEAALKKMCLTEVTSLDEDVIAAINEGGVQADRGEGMELEAFCEQWKKRIGTV